jgi:uncharacterized protein GlcG (DUF336 family)
MKPIAAALVVLSLAASAPSMAQLVTVKQLSREMVLTLLSTAAKCANTDKVTIAVVDRNQSVLAQFRGPTGTVGAMDVARRKANTAVQFGQPTSAIATANQANPARAAMMASAGDLVLGGAVPIKVGDEIIGAIGVSGAAQAEEPCANAAVEAIQSQLK